MADAETDETTTGETEVREALAFTARLWEALEAAGAVLIVHDPGAGQVHVRPTPELARPGGIVARLEGGALVVLPVPSPDGAPEEAGLNVGQYL